MQGMFLVCRRQVEALIDRLKNFGVLKKREERRLEAGQMKILRRLLGITKLDKEKNQFIEEKQEHRS
jgi:hypothetical protein